MTWFLVLWVSFTCPGGWLAAKAIPIAAQQYACTPKPEWAIETRPERAYARVKEAGCRARILECRGLRCREKEVSCETKLSVEGL